MSDTALTKIVIEINNDIIVYTPNTLTVTFGTGEQTVKVQSAGGGNIQTVYFDNIETKMSKINFSVFNTPSNLDLVANWKANNNLNTIRIYDVDTNWTVSFASAALTNDYQANFNQDGNIDIEFMAEPAV